MGTACPDPEGVIRTPMIFFFPAHPPPAAGVATHLLLPDSTPKLLPGSLTNGGRSQVVRIESDIDSDENYHSESQSRGRQRQSRSLNTSICGVTGGRTLRRRLWIVKDPRVASPAVRGLHVQTQTQGIAESEDLDLYLIAHCDRLSVCQCTVTFCRPCP